MCLLSDIMMEQLASTSSASAYTAQSEEWTEQRRKEERRSMNEEDGILLDAEYLEKHGPRFGQSMNELREEKWYWGAISANQAIRLLRGREPGTFLVRDSHSESFIFTISYVAHNNKVYHSRLARFNGRFCLGGPNALIRSSSLIQFVKQTVGLSNDERHQLRILMHPSSLEPAAIDIQMKYPLGRTHFMVSLKYICRLTIRHHIQDTRIVNIISLTEFTWLGLEIMANRVVPIADTFSTFIYRSLEYSAGFHVLLISLNRVHAIFSPMHYQLVWTKRLTFYLCMMSWVFGSCVSFLSVYLVDADPSAFTGHSIKGLALKDYAAFDPTVYGANYSSSLINSSIVHLTILLYLSTY
uniref:SH2 domain-containing protein n=1 Tax=Ditylenchus dipsaci TaxID=166011 RepID=A0A915EEL1_9BILA